MFRAISKKLEAKRVRDRRPAELKPDGATPKLFETTEQVKISMESLNIELGEINLKVNEMFRSDASELYEKCRLFATKEDLDVNNWLSGISKGMDLTKAAFFFLTANLEQEVYSKEMDKLIRRIVCECKTEN